MEYKQVLIVNTDLKMGKGKICSQVAHASIHAYLKTDKKIREEWLREGSKKVVLKASEEKLLEIGEKALRLGLPTAIIRDAGLTQIAPNSTTALGIGPVKDKEVDDLTRELKLL